MASREELYALVGRAIADPAFGQKVKQDVVAAATENGVDLSPDQKQWLASNPTQWRNFLGLIQAPGQVGELNCGTCIVDGH